MLRLVCARTERVREPLTSVALNDEIECEVFPGRVWRVIHEWNDDGQRALSLRSGNWLIQRRERALTHGNEGWRRA